MAKNDIDPAVLQAVDRLEGLRDYLIQKMASTSKLSIESQLRLFLDAEDAIEKLNKLKRRRAKRPAAARGPISKTRPRTSTAPPLRAARPARA